MKQLSVLTHTMQLPAQSSALLTRWTRYFFTEQVTPDNHAIVTLQRRAVWIGLALLLQSLNEIAQAISSIDTSWYRLFQVLFASFLPLTLTLASFFAMWMAFRPAHARQQEMGSQAHPSFWQKFILLAALVLAIVGSIVGGITLVNCFLPPAYTNDGTSLDTNAAILLLQGRNPYTDSNILDVAHQFPIQPTWTTPLRKGQFADRLDYPSTVDTQSAFDTDNKSDNAPEFESKVSYPALSFLTLVPFALFKYYNVFPLYLGCYVLLIVLAWKAAQPALRPWVLLLALGNVPMWSSTLGGNLDIFYVLLIILAWLQREQRWMSALLLGLACASKQIAWLFVPFYVIMIWRTLGLKEALHRMLITGGIALLINLPFIAWNPHAWLAGVLAPVADPMFPMGVGIINLSTSHLLPYLPSAVYAGLEAFALLGALGLYWRICQRRPEAAMLLAVIPLFFAWRSLPSYFFCTAYPIFMLMTSRMLPGLRKAPAYALAHGNLPLFTPLSLSPSLPRQRQG